MQLRWFINNHSSFIKASAGFMEAAALPVSYATRKVAASSDYVFHMQRPCFFLFLATTMLPRPIASSTSACTETQQANMALIKIQNGSSQTTG